MALIPQAQIVQGGLVSALQAAAVGDFVIPGQTSFLVVKNGSGAAVTVTVDSVAPCSYGFDHDLVVVIAAGASADIGPLPTSRFGNPADGFAHISYSSVATVTVANKVL